MKVLLPLPFDQAFDYHNDKPLAPGTFVQVPFGKREVYGIVWPEDKEQHTGQLKSVTKVLNFPPLQKNFLDFIKWVSDYTLMPLGMVLRMVIPMQNDLFIQAEEILYGFGKFPQKLTPLRQRVLECFQSAESLSLNALKEDSKASSGVINALIKEGSIVPYGVQIKEVDRQTPTYQNETVQFSSDQQFAANELIEKVTAHQFNVTLLDGVTGSGKTEVYFAAVAQAIQQGGQALILLPEIALSAQWMDRFKKRFGIYPDVWHSELTKPQRRDVWRSVSNGKSKVVVGARSALFLPFQNLHLLIIDEEHDASYKQEEGGYYHARDMAVVRCLKENIPCVLASATPSLETIYNCQQNKYNLLPLKSRHGDASMPEVSLIDMRQASLKGQWISEIMRNSLKETLDKNEQAMVFLNRRGYAPLVLCTACGDRINCHQCSVSLVYHKKDHQLICHHCGFKALIPKQCISCGEEDSYLTYGPGVEKIAEEVKAFLPQARVSLMTSDVLSTPSKIKKLVKEVQDHQIDILVGTQIMAKGHHFPLLTCVGVVDADASLSGSDLRGAEKTYQLLHQLAGRSGREDREGKVFLQTYIPHHPVMQALKMYERDKFLSLESESRKQFDFPPYGRFIALIISSENQIECEKISKYLANSFPAINNVHLLGPVQAPLSFVRGRYRWRILIKTTKDLHIQSHLKKWLSDLKLPPSVRVQVDVDPYSFL